MRDHDLSQRRACVLVGVDPKTVCRDRPPDNPDIREAMGKRAEKRRRFGYPLAGRRLQAIAERRRIGVLLERKGMAMNHKKLYRLYREDGLSVRRHRGRKRARGSRSPMPEALRPNQRWSMDFVSDTFGPSRRFRILAVNDDCCRENLGLVADTSISGAVAIVARTNGATKGDRARVGCDGAALRQAGQRRLGQRHRVHQQGDPEMGEGQ
jgi:putative transposase